QGSLSGTVGPQDGKNPTLVNMKVQPGQNRIFSEFLMKVFNLYHWFFLIKGLASINSLGVNTGDTFSEKSMMSINRLRKRIMVSGVLFTIYENNFTGL